MRPESPVPSPTLSDPEKRGTACAALYENAGVRWVMGGELHPGGEATTRRALELVGLGPADRLLDVACGQGTSVLLAAREFGSRAVGADLSDSAFGQARAEAVDEGIGGRVSFVRADALDLPFEDASFDAVLCECSLSSFADKPRAASEIARVLRPGGRAAVSDVVADPERIPTELRGSLATLACLGEALDVTGYRRILAGAGLRSTAMESADDAAARLAERVEDRLRGARLLGFDELDEAIELVRLARRAIAEGSLGYAVFAADR
jgi:arsenite methyltransferase